jgi:hypothetical protein
MQADKRSGSATDPQSLNVYSYVRNDPTGAIDPLGLDTCYLDGFQTDCRFVQGLSREAFVDMPLGWNNPIHFSVDGQSGWIFPTVTNDPDDPFQFDAFFNGRWRPDLGQNDLIEFLGYVPIFGFGAPSTPPSGINGLRLEPITDYCSGGDRNIDYRVVQYRKGIPGGTIGEKYYVTEHQSDQSVSGPGGMSTNPSPNWFRDLISSAGLPPSNTIQSFTVSLSARYSPSMSMPILVRYGGQDYASLGIWLRYNPIVNGRTTSLVNGRPNGCNGGR